MERTCKNCAHAWLSAFNGWVCMDGWGENGVDIPPSLVNKGCYDWEPETEDDDDEL